MNTKKTIDNELLALYQQGDFRGFERFYQRHHTLIFQFLMYRLRNRADAEEAFQETFLRMHRFITSYDPDQSALGWVFAIARNVALDTHARRKPSVDLETVDLLSDGDTEDMIRCKEDIQRLWSQLTDEDKILLEGRILEDKDFERLARELKSSSSTLRQRFSRLLRKLRSLAE